MSSLRPTFLRAAAVALLCGGCAVGPSYHSPVADVPQNWGAGAPAGAASTALWWHGFNDPELTSLAERALKGNLDVQIAESRLRQARAARRVAAGGFWPAITASGSAQRGATSGGASANTFQAGLDAIWELDLFGGVRRSVESAEASSEAAKAGLDDVRVSLVAEVAFDYVQARSFQEQIAIARENLSSQRHTADIVHQRLKVGFSSALDAANADAQAATTAATLSPLDTALRQAIHALSVLIGRPPDELLGELSQPGVLPPAPPAIPVGLPSDLVRRRPDIHAAEAQLHAATAQVGVAVSDFFPKFPLTAAVGYQGSLMRTLFATGNRTWSVGPGVTWPILQGGSTLANVRLQQALRDQSYLTYRKTVLVALQEVEDSLVALGNEQDHGKALAEAVIQNRRAVDLAKHLYSEGQADFLSVLDAQRLLYTSQIALAQSRQAESADAIALYKALGGGWEDSRG